MDKNSLSEWGWIVIIVIILSILIAFAAPFGKFVVASVQNALNDLNQAAIETMPIKAPKNLKIIGDSLSYDPVKGATGYEITIGDGAPFEATDTTINISDQLSVLEGTVAITVVAKRNEDVSPKATISYLIPGLYETGSNYTKLLTPWKELLSAGVIHVDNGVVYTNFNMNALVAPMLEDVVMPTNTSSEILKGDLALPNDSSITAIGDAIVDEENMTIEGNVAFGFCEYLTGIKIPASVTDIGEVAFLACLSLSELKIPDNVTSIGRSAFSQCIGLESVVLSNNITVIKDSTFSNCESITTIILPNKLKVVESYAFTSCYALENISIPLSVETIGDRAFDSCGSIKKLSISENVKNIGVQAFTGCYGLTELTVSSKNTRYKMIDNCLVDTVTKTLMFTIDGCTIPTSDILHIDPYACHMRTNLVNVVLPDGLLTIGNNAFVACTNLESIVIPSSVTKIGEYAFYNCPKLESITIPEKVTVIGGYTFRYGENLKTVNLPASLTEIGYSAFLECPNLTDIYFDGTQEQWNSVTKKYNWNRDTGAYTVHCSDIDIAK